MMIVCITMHAKCTAPSHCVAWLGWYYEYALFGRRSGMGMGSGQFSNFILRILRILIPMIFGV